MSIENIKCWWCIDNIKQNYPIPIKYEKKKYSVIGNFCCINCSLSYILHNNLLYSKTLLIQLLYKMYKKYIKDTTIIPSPPKEILICFGGSVTYEEYNKLKLNYINIIYPPMVSINIEFEKVNFNKKENIKSIPITDNQINNAKNNLLLKRKKPIKSKYISIEKTMGLIKIK